MIISRAGSKAYAARFWSRFCNGIVETPQVLKVSVWLIAKLDSLCLPGWGVPIGVA